MLTFASKFPKDVQSEISTALNPILPDSYCFFINEFEVTKVSDIAGETQFNLVCRVNVDSVEKIDGLLTDIGKKSGTAYNKFKGDKQGKGKKTIISGSRKCIHSVIRHGLKKDTQPHSGSG